LGYLNNHQGEKPTCVVSENGTMVFGTASGHIVLADRDFHVSERKYKVFKGEIKGIVLLVDPSNTFNILYQSI